MHYPHTMKPFDHQRTELEEHWNTPWRAIFWEQGLGKMKAGWDWALTLWQAQQIDTFVVLAPNGVHRDWIEEGFKEGNADDPFDQPLVPEMWQDQINAEFYQSQKAGAKWHQARMRDLFYTKADKLAVLSMTYDAAKTKSQKNTTGWIGGRLFLTKMLKERKSTAFLLDESAVIQTPSSQITKTVVGHGGRGGVAKFAHAARIMDGTPVDEGPFNVYSQMQALDPDFWRDRGFASFSSFKAYFGVFREGRSSSGKSFQQVVAYQNLDELHDILKPHSTRVLKRDALDLPPKLYQHHRFDLSPEQWKLYKQLDEELMIEARADGADVESLITAEQPIVNILKLYQITCGYLPFLEDENGEPMEKTITFKENPRLEEAVAHLKKSSGKQVIWCRFTRDIDLLLASLGSKAVRYDGKVDDDTRANNKREFLRGDAQYIVPQIQAMAKGHTLNICENVLYYSNDSRLRLRRQSEDRTHRGRMTHSVLYTDMLASDTVDEKRVRNLRKKLVIAERIMGDNR